MRRQTAYQRDLLRRDLCPRCGGKEPLATKVLATGRHKKMSLGVRCLAKVRVWHRQVLGLKGTQRNIYLRPKGSK